jgi:peptidoglycan/LPS O-acetylase OafA/YrhL
MKVAAALRSVGKLYQLPRTNWQYFPHSVLGGRESIEAALKRNSGVGPGFDYLRVTLALVILLLHVVGSVRGEGEQSAIGFIVYGKPENSGAQLLSWWEAWAPWRHAVQGLLVPMFFALSGFLVTASALRLRNVRSFLLFRGLRIFPALTVEVVLSALILGPVYTDLAITSYFGSYGFFRYFGNILGFVTFYLPGVFENNPWPKIVNANLWTLPAEFYCYAILAFCMISRIIYKRMYFTIFFCALSVVFIYSLFPAVGPLLPDIGPGFARSFGVTYYFFVGCLFFHWRSWISINRSAFLISGLLSLVFLEENFARGEVVVLAALTPFVLTYCTVVLGIANWPKLPLVRNGDYSYGIYLYGFPITQALIASFPGLRGHIWLMLLIAPALTTMFSVLSWHRIEHPVLQLKKRFGPVSRPV